MSRREPAPRPFRLVRVFQPSRTAATTLALAYQRLGPARGQALPGSAPARPAPGRVARQAVGG